MPQGEFTYSLAEHAEMTVDFTKAAFACARAQIHDGHPLTTGRCQMDLRKLQRAQFQNLP